VERYSGKFTVGTTMSPSVWFRCAWVAGVKSISKEYHGLVGVLSQHCLEWEDIFDILHWG